MARKNPPEKRQSFSINGPTATSVLLVGDFTHWQEHAIGMKKDAKGIWKAIVELRPGTYHYRFIVDGQWRDDPDCKLRVPNPYGSQDSVRQVI